MKKLYRRNVITFLLLVLISCSGYSQDDKKVCNEITKKLYGEAKDMSYYQSDSFFIMIDSLSNHLKSSCLDTNAYVTTKLLEKSYYLNIKDSLRVDSLSVVIENFFGEKKLSNAYYLYLFSLAVGAHIAPDIPKARALYQKIYEDTQPTWKDVFFFKTKVISNWAHLEIDQGNYDLSLTLLEEALDNVKTYGKDKSENAINIQMFNLYNTKGILMKRIRDLAKASYYYKQALNLFPKNHSYNSIALTNYLEVLTLQDSSQQVIDLANEYLEITKDKDNLSYLYSNLMIAYLTKEQLSSAKILFNKTLRDFKNLDEYDSAIRQRILKLQGDYLLSKGDKSRAQEKYYQRLNAIEGNNLEVVRASTLQDLVTSFLFHDKKQLKLYEDYVDIIDSIQLATIDSEIKKWETKYQTAQKEAENKLLQADKQVHEATIKRQQIWMTGLGVGLAGLLFGLFMFSKRSKERKNHIDVLASKNQKIEALNRETIHRTKNYLNLATALLNKNKVRTDDPQIAEALEENEKRLKVLAKLNTKLSADGEKTQLSTKEYISELIDDLEFSFQRTRQRGAHIKKQVAELPLESDKCLYLGLIINELIVNSFKHAKPTDDMLEIDVILQKQGEEVLALSYHDNGQNEDPEKKSTSKGTELILDLFQQMKGEYSINFSDGYSFNGWIPL